MDLNIYKGQEKILDEVYIGNEKWWVNKIDRWRDGWYGIYFNFATPWKIWPSILYHAFIDSIEIIPTGLALHILNTIQHGTMPAVLFFPIIFNNIN